MKCAGLDLGTTKIAGLLLDTDADGRTGRVLHTISRDHRAGLPGRHPWEHLQDPERILDLARETLAELEAAAGPIDGLCVTGQVHGILYLDAGGRAVSPLATWLDGRAALPHPDGGSHAESLSRLTGHHVSPGYGAATHYYNRRHDLVPPGAASLCALLDYVTMRLAGGRRPVSDPSVSAALGLYDLAADRFDADALRRAGLDDLGWSRVAPAGTRVGATPAGISVFVPLGDNQAGFLGSVRRLERAALVNIGTGGQISVFTRELRRPAPPLEIRPFPGGGFLMVGAALCSGQAYALLEEFFRRTCAELGGERPREAVFERMNALALEEEGPEERPLEVDTRFQGTRADPAITGSIGGITLTNLTPAALVRGFLRGMAAELHGYYRAIMQEAGPSEGRRMAEVVAGGNAIRRNAALRAEVSRRFGLPVLVPARAEEAALGAALSAAVGLGAFAGFDAVGSLIEYEPA